VRRGTAFEQQSDAQSLKSSLKAALVSCSPPASPRILKAASLSSFVVVNLMSSHPNNYAVHFGLSLTAGTTENGDAALQSAYGANPILKFYRENQFSIPKKI